MARSANWMSAPIRAQCVMALTTLCSPIQCICAVVCSLVVGCAPPSMLAPLPWRCRPSPNGSASLEAAGRPLEVPAGAYHWLAATLPASLVAVPAAAQADQREVRQKQRWGGWYHHCLGGWSRQGHCWVTMPIAEAADWRQVPMQQSWTVDKLQAPADIKRRV
jgi:hypothetical protein